MYGFSGFIGVDIFNGEYPPGVVFAERPNLLRPFILLSMNLRPLFFLSNGFDTPYFMLNDDNFVCNSQEIKIQVKI